jgi:UDP-N-acetylmuramoyl-tripeptide--D-alanyl-D-alanine ligase
VGERFDGHDYIAKALDQGATGFLYNKSNAEKLDATLLNRGIPVDDTLLAFQKIAQGWRRTLNLKLLALTGSTGKTTVKELLDCIMKKAGPSFSTHGSFNNEIGVPKTLLSLKPEHQFGVLEFGARKQNDIRFLVEMAEPDIGGVLNVGRTHLEIFGSEEILLTTKMEMISSAKPGSLGVIYMDDERILEKALECQIDLYTFGLSPKATVCLTYSEFLGDGGMLIKLDISGDLIEIRTATCHAALPINICAAAAMATAAGVLPDTISASLESYKGIKGRFQTHKVGSKILIDDAYNASPDSMLAGFKTLDAGFSGKSRALILGDMLELGPTAQKDHETTGAAAQNLVKPEYLIAIGAHASSIVKGAVDQGMDSGRTKIYSNVEEYLQTLSWPLVDVTYVKASNGIGLGKVVDQLLALEGGPS